MISNWTGTAKNYLNSIVVLTHGFDFLTSLGLHSLPIPKNVISCGLQIFPHVEAFECNTTSSWLNWMV